MPLMTYPVVQIEVTQFHINVIPRLREAATLKNSNDIFMFVEQTERDDCTHFVNDVFFFHVGRQSDEFSSKHLKSIINIAGFNESEYFQLPFLCRYYRPMHG